VICGEVEVTPSMWPPRRTGRMETLMHESPKSTLTGYNNHTFIIHILHLVAPSLLPTTARRRTRQRDSETARRRPDPPYSI